MLARQGVFVELNEDDHGDMVEIINNTDLNTHFLSLAREVRPKRQFGPEVEKDICRRHDQTGSFSQVCSPKLFVQVLLIDLVF